MPLSTSNPGFGRISPAQQVERPARLLRDDETLVAEMRAANPASFQAFYRKYSTFVCRVLLRTIGDDAELDILIHEVFTKAFQNIDALRNPSQVKSWIASIAVHTARDTLKQRKRSKWLRFFEPAKLPEPVTANEDGGLGYDNFGDKEEVEAVYRVLDALSVDARVAFTLRYMNEMALTEVAAACNVSLATIKRRLAKAKRQFSALAKNEIALRKWVQNA